MKRIAILCSLVLAAACGPDLVQPTPDVLAAPDLALAAGEKWEFASELTFTGTVEPGDVRLSHSGVLHGSNLINEFDVTGDLVGTWFFQGKYHINLNNGKGRSIVQPSLLVITSPMVGSFECHGSAKIENYPTDQFIQYGRITGCHGMGDYEGMKMRSNISNERTPGLGAVAVYDLWGEIW